MKLRYTTALTTTLLALLLPTAASAAWGPQERECSLRPATHCYSISFWPWNPNDGPAVSYQAKVKTSKIKIPYSTFYSFVSNEFWLVWYGPYGELRSWIEAGQIRTSAGRIEPMKGFWAYYVNGEYVQHISEERAYPGKVDTFTITDISNGYGQWCVKWYVPSPIEVRSERNVGCIYNPGGPNVVESGAEMYTAAPPEVEGTVEVRNLSQFAPNPFLAGSFQDDTGGGCGTDEIYIERFRGGVQCGYTTTTRPEGEGSKTLNGTSPR